MTATADAHDAIAVNGANLNNLKHVGVETLKRRLTAFAGVSGSGKSSLVFGTVAATGSVTGRSLAEAANLPV